MEPKQVFVCQNCFRQHVRNTGLVDEQIICDCGFKFFAFGNAGLTVTVPSRELQNEAVAVAMRRMIISTGRCQDIPVQKLMTSTDYSRLVLDQDPVKLMEEGLQRYQMETFGTSLLTAGKVISICESLVNELDVEVKNQRGTVAVYEVKRKKKTEIA